MSTRVTVSGPVSVGGRNDRVELFSNEMDVVLDIVEQVARIVPLSVLDELGTAARYLEELKAWDANEFKIADAALALDNARDLVPGCSLTLVVLSPNESTALAEQLTRLRGWIEQVAL